MQGRDPDHLGDRRGSDVHDRERLAQLRAHPVPVIAHREQPREVSAQTRRHEHLDYSGRSSDVDPHQREVVNSHPYPAPSRAPPRTSPRSPRADATYVLA